MTALRQLASVLGATLLIEEHDDLVAAVARVVRERGSTYIMVGEADPPRGLARLREPLPQRLMRATPPGVDVRIVAHRGRKEERAVIEHVLVGVALLVGLGGGYLIARSRLRGRRSERPDAVHQILLPFTGTEVSRRALDAALRLARAEDATLMPAYLAQVPKSLPLECAIPNEAAGRCRCWRRSNSGPPPRGSPSTPGSSAAAPTATRSSACWRGRASTASSCRRAPRAPPASPATTSSGCCEGPGRGADPAARPRRPATWSARAAPA